MRKKATRTRTIDPDAAANERMQQYCKAHPHSPSAIQRPHLFLRDQLWIVLVGPDSEDGVIGIGATVEEALSDFDSRYLARLEPGEANSSARTAAT